MRRACLGERRASAVISCVTENVSVRCRYACVSAGELKVNNVKRARENPEAKRENAFTRLRVSTKEQSASPEKVIKRTRHD